MKKLICSLCGLLVVGASANAQTILADWTFETSAPVTTPGPGVPTANYSPEVGSGAAFGLHAGNSVYTSPAGNGSAHSFSSTVWAVGDYYEFSTSTAGFSDISVSYDQTSSGTGPGNFKLQYSVNGTSFTDFGSVNTVLANASPNPTWNGTTHSSIYTFNYDLSSITALNNQSTVYFRVVDTSTTSAGGGTVASGGTDRIDNFIISVPEPSSLALFGGFGLLAWFMARRRN